MRGYPNLHIPADTLPTILEHRCTVLLPSEEARRVQRLQDVAAQALKTYTDRFVRMKERQAESQHVEPAYLDANDERVLTQYTLRVKEDALIKQIETLLTHGRLQKELHRMQQGQTFFEEYPPLPRLYFDRSLFNPLLKTDANISILPPGLGKDESRFVRDVYEYWRRHHRTMPDCELYLLRNLAVSGIGLFHRSGFYPDFILWLHDTQTGKTHVCFLDPHGLHHDGLSGTEDKFAALRALSDLSLKQEFHQRGITLSGYILTSTTLDQIPDRNGRTKAELEKAYALLFLEDGYIGKVLRCPQK